MESAILDVEPQYKFKWLLLILQFSFMYFLKIEKNKYKQGQYCEMGT